MPRSLFTLNCERAAWFRVAGFGPNDPCLRLRLDPAADLLVSQKRRYADAAIRLPGSKAQTDEASGHHRAGGSPQAAGSTCGCE